MGFFFNQHKVQAKANHTQEEENSSSLNISVMTLVCWFPIVILFVFWEVIFIIIIRLPESREHVQGKCSFKVE